MLRCYELGDGAVCVGDIVRWLRNRRWGGGELISFSSLERYIGSVAMGSSSSSIRNVVVISAKAFSLKCFSAVIEGTKF